MTDVRLWRNLVGSVVLSLTACSGDSANVGGINTARLRYVHAIADTSAVDVRIRGVLRSTLTAVPYGAATDYETVASGLLSVSSQPAPSASADAPRSIANLGTVFLTEGSTVTLVAIGEARDTVSARAAGIGGYLDDLTKPPTGQARLRVINGSMDAGAVDVYATLVGGTRAGVPTFAGIDYRSALTRSLPAGSYAFTITPLSDTTVVLATTAAVLPDGGVQTIVIRGYGTVLPAGVAGSRRISTTSMVNVAP